MSKTKKIILFIISFSVCISLLTVSAFAQTYEFDKSTILTEDTELHVTNGVGYHTHRKPILYFDSDEWAETEETKKYGDNYVFARYNINYNPPTGGSNDKKKMKNVVETFESSIKAIIDGVLPPSLKSIIKLADAKIFDKMWDGFV
jgi:hypothetical protein